MPEKKVWPHGNYGDVTIDFFEEWMQRNEEWLRPHRAEVPKTWRRKAIAEYYFPRDCFARAIQFITLSRHLPQAEYLFGEAACGGLEQHGWVEIDGVIFDGVMQEFYTRSGYYSEGVRPWYRFDRQATLWIDRMSKRHAGGSYRWDSVLRLPWSDYVSLPLIDLETAMAYWQKAQERRKAEEQQTQKRTTTSPNVSSPPAPEPGPGN
jgi:hypothetical protein